VIFLSEASCKFGFSDLGRLIRPDSTDGIPQEYEKQVHKFKGPLLLIKEKVSKREGTHNVVVTAMKRFAVLDKMSHQSLEWG
jgi:hypothetical protein